MSNISELFNDFHNYEYDTQKAFDFLFAKTIANEFTVLGLKEFTLKKLSNILNVPLEDLQKEFDDHCEFFRNNAVADFLSKFGSLDDPQDSQ